MANRDTANLVHRGKNLLRRFEGLVDTFQVLLSMLAVTLVVANEFVLQNFQVPYFNLSWEHLQVYVRGFTWAVFVFDFVLYGIASGRPLRYARRHLLELVICITWVPYYSPSLLGSVSSSLSLDVLTLSGSIAHFWMVCRWTVRRFAAHPHIVVASITAVMMVTTSAILTRVEPETFGNFRDAIWFCLQTVFTVGYGEITPKTDAGRAVAALLILGGVAIGWVYIALLTKWVSAHLLKDQNDPVVQLTKRVEDQGKAIEALREETRAANELNRQLLEELRTRRSAEPSNNSDK